MRTIKGQHRLLSLLLTACMVCALLFTGWTGTMQTVNAQTPEGFAGGSGTAADPWLVETAEQLDLLRNYLDVANQDKHFRLTNDIDLGPYLAAGGAGHDKWGELGWEPIGKMDGSSKTSTRFYGTLDGNGYAVNNLWISRPEENSAALFGYTCEAVIANLGVTVAENRRIQGRQYTAGLIGYQWDGSVSNCSLSGTVEGYTMTGGLVGYLYGGKIENSLAYGQVTGTNAQTGGLVGGTQMDAVVTGSVSYCDVTGTEQTGGLVGAAVGVNGETGSRFHGCSAFGAVVGTNETGGLIGRKEYGSVSECFADCAVEGQQYVGGLFGAVSTQLSNCYAAGSTTGTAARYTGGLIGRASGGYTFENCYAVGLVTGGNGGFAGDVASYITLKDCFFDTQATGQTQGVASNATKAGVTGKATADLKKQATFTNWDFTGVDGAAPVWFLVENETYPLLFSQVSSGGDGSQANPYLITTPAQLDHIRQFLGDTYQDTHWKLGNDINLEYYSAAVWGNEGWNPIGTTQASFTGTLDGNGKVVSGLWLNRTADNYTGLFRSLAGTVRNMGLVIGDGGVNGKGYVGGLTGLLGGGMVSGVYVTGGVNGSICVGGISGNLLNATIQDCYTNVKITAATDFGGGITGQMINGQMINCYASGTAAGENTAGLVANNVTGTVSHCFYENSTGLTGPGTGLSADDLMKKSTFTNEGWDFSNAWGMYTAQDNETGYGYPYLKTVDNHILITPADSQKVYDGAEVTEAPAWSASPVANYKPNQSAISGAAAFATAPKAVGSYPVTAGTLDLNNPYYQISFKNDVRYEITAKPLTVTGTTVADKTYDGGLTATVSNAGRLNGAVNHDEVGFTVSAVFRDAAVGASKHVDLTYALTGKDAKNYTLPSTGTATAAIGQAEPSIRLEAEPVASAVYGENNVALTATVTGIAAESMIGSVQFKVNDQEIGVVPLGENGTAAWTGTLDAGEAYTLTAVYSGGGNYAPAETSITDYDVLKAAQTIPSIVEGGQSKTYGDAPFVLNATGGESTGNYLWNSSNPSVVTVDGNGLVTIVGAGTADITVQKAGDGNYNESFASEAVTVTVNPKFLTISVSADNKVYDGSITATLNISGLQGIVGNDEVFVENANANGTFDTKNAGSGKMVNIPVLILAGVDAGNYVLVQPGATTADITEKPLIVSGVTVSDKIFDGTTGAAACGGKLEGVVNGDEVGFTVTAEFQSTNAGQNKTVDLTYALTGKDKENYSLPSAGTTTATIKKADAAITEKPTAANLYQGETLSGSALTGGTASVPGAFVWSNPDERVNTTDVYQITFQPEDAGNYNAAVADVEVTVLDKSVLDELIEAANAVRNSAVIGIGDGEYLQSAVDAFSTAIAQAQSVSEKVAADQTKERIDSAVQQLQKAMDAFQANVMDKSQLTDTVKEAESLLKDAGIGSEAGLYPQNAVDKLKQAVDQTNEILTKTGVTQAELDKATDELRAAIDLFQRSVNQELPVPPTTSANTDLWLMMLGMTAALGSALLLTKRRKLRR